MSVAKKEIKELQVENIAFGGNGIAKIEGFTIFVDQGLPGDYVKALIVEKKKNSAIAKIVEFLEESPFRVKSKCKYAGYCGGCKWIFLNYEKQLEYKRNHIEESLRHIGKINDVFVHPVASSDSIFGYRNKMVFAFGDKPETNAGFALGLHTSEQSEIFDTEKCPLLPELGASILNDIRMFVRNRGWLSAFWRFVMLRYSFTYDKWMINIVTTSENRKITEPLADFLLAKYSNKISVINNINPENNTSHFGKYRMSLAGDDYIKEKIGGFDFRISANSFFQINTYAAEKLYKAIFDYAGLTGTERVIDLYSGIGSIAIFVSGRAKEVTGIEIMKSAVKDAEENARLNQVENCNFFCSDIKKNFAKIPYASDVVIADPPRAGIDKKVLSRIVEFSPKRIIYVSCNPASLARDLKLLQNFYHIVEIFPIDMFPHTYHIESVTLMDRSFFPKIIKKRTKKPD